MVSRRFYLATIVPLAVAFLALALGGADLVHRINHRSNVRNAETTIVNQKVEDVRMADCSIFLDPRLSSSPVIQHAINQTWPIDAKHNTILCPPSEVTP